MTRPAAVIRLPWCNARAASDLGAKRACRRELGGAYVEHRLGVECGRMVGDRRQP